MLPSEPPLPFFCTDANLLGSTHSKVSYEANPAKVSQEIYENVVNRQSIWSAKPTRPSPTPRVYALNSRLFARKPPPAVKSEFPHCEIGYCAGKLIGSIVINPQKQPSYVAPVC